MDKLDALLSEFCDAPTLYYVHRESHIAPLRWARKGCYGPFLSRHNAERFAERAATEVPFSRFVVEGRKP